MEDIIERLLKLRGSKIPNKGFQVDISETEIIGLCAKARELFMAEPRLLELHAPIKVTGDVFGHYRELLRLFEYVDFPPKSNFLFLGNYVDHGPNSMETICLFLAYKIKYPKNFYMLRGNHESGSMNKLYGFRDHVKKRLVYSFKSCSCTIGEGGDGSTPILKMN